MLPKRMRESLFERASVKTMRYVKAVPIKSAVGLTKRVYEMIAEDFFVNGSLSSHSAVPELFAGTWVGGRELVVVGDKLDRTTKEAMGATLSYINDCPYCADMLVSLVHGSGKHQSATNILNEQEDQIDDPVLRERLNWVRNVVTAGPETISDSPFTSEQLPEAIGALYALHYVNRFSHVAMDGSPVGEMFKNTSLRLFGYELRETTERPLQAGRALDLLPPAPVSEEFRWAQPNPRLADALSRWEGAVERHAEVAISPKVRDLVQKSLADWDGARMPISRGWVESEISHLSGQDYHKAKLILVVAKSSYQFDESLVTEVLGEQNDQEQLIRVLAYAAFSAARRLCQHYGDVLQGTTRTPHEYGLV